MPREEGEWGYSDHIDVMTMMITTMIITMMITIYDNNNDCCKTLRDYDMSNSLTVIAGGNSVILYVRIPRVLQ